MMRPHRQYAIGSARPIRYMLLLGATTLMPLTSSVAGELLTPNDSESALERESTPGASRAEYVIGLSLKSSPEYSGSRRQGLSLGRVLAIRYGRFRISSAGGSSLMNIGTTSDAGADGASAELINSDRWSANLALRIGGGRDASDSEALAGLPDIEQTLFGRLRTSYNLAEGWDTWVSVSHDLLGRNNGTSLSTGLGYKLKISPRTEWSLSGDLAYGNANHMNSLFGVPATAENPDRAAYTPGSGLKSIGFGVRVTSALTDNWVLFSRFGVSRLLGPAADSPLSEELYGVTARIGIAWRCCR